MTDRPDKRSKLIAETFHDEWATGPAADFARAAAAHARARRRSRAILSASGVMAMVVAIGVISAHRSAPVPVPPTRPLVALNRLPSAPAPRGYEIISDDQLLAQLHDRPLLMVQQENGSRKVVLLENE